MPIFPNQYPEKLNPNATDKLLMADGASGNAIKSVQAKKVADLAIEIIKGGATGQVLTKAGADDFDVGWKDIPHIDYKTTEQDTGEKWIDGKTIYKKTINFGTLPNATTKAVAHGILNLDWVVKYEAMAKRAQGWQGLPLVYRHTDAAFNAAIEFSPVNIVIATDQDRSSFTQCFVTLYYTKAGAKK